MGKIGFGTYRVSSQSQEHYRALLAALRAGITLIDTSSNYTDGESEELIGKVLKDYPEFHPQIVTKAGYIQGKNLNHIVTDEDLVDLGETLKHSIHPLFLEDQITRSLKRLQKEKVDVLLLHNPEYYFESVGATEEEFYRRIKLSFFHLESEVARGRISSYGISSNHFILPPSDKECVSLERVIKIADEVALDGRHHFTHIQFPMNLIEIGAMEKNGNYGPISLLEMAQLNQLTTMINRPLNAFTQGRLVRLAHYKKSVEQLDELKAREKFNECIGLIEEKWREEHLSDGETEIDDVREVTLVKQFSEMWDKLPSPDAVDQVYFGHLFPFVAQVWGGELSVLDSQPFYDLYDYSQLYSRKMMDYSADQFYSKAQTAGLLGENASRNLAEASIETYLNYGVDYVLVGMKKVEYVDQLKEYF